MAQPQQLQLAPMSDLDGEKFQTYWMQLPDGGTINRPIKPNLIPNTGAIEAKMKEANIQTMASGQVGDEIKFYFHCQLADRSGYALAEIIFRQSMRQITGIMKTTRSEMAPAFVA